uniref:Uncharacterized protein n=1 Tax=Hyaloperonospora arabidopsidis (strain Emoy2) TaxID=559515 RepID=M4BVE0_HYAAE
MEKTGGDSLKTHLLNTTKNQAGPECLALRECVITTCHWCMLVALIAGYCTAGGDVRGFSPEVYLSKEVVLRNRKRGAQLALADPFT